MARCNGLCETLTTVSRTLNEPMGHRSRRLTRPPGPVQPGPPTGLVLAAACLGSLSSRAQYEIEGDRMGSRHGLVASLIAACLSGPVLAQPPTSLAPPAAPAAPPPASPSATPAAAPSAPPSPGPSARAPSPTARAA